MIAILLIKSPQVGPLFPIFHANSCSINKYLESFIDFISTLNHAFSVIKFGETWLGDNISPLVHIEDYLLTDNHRAMKRGGGVGIFASNKLSFARVGSYQRCVT